MFGTVMDRDLKGCRFGQLHFDHRRGPSAPDQLGFAIREDPPRGVPAAREVEMISRVRESQLPLDLAQVEQPRAKGIGERNLDP